MKFPKIRNPLDYVYPEPGTIRKYLHFCERHPLYFSIIIFLLTLSSLWGTIRLYTHVDTSLTALLPEYYKSVQTLNKIDQEGAKQAESVLVEGDDSDELVSFATELKANLEKNPIVFRVQIKRDHISKDYALLVLNEDRLLSIRDRVKKKISQGKLKRSGFFINFEEDVPATQAPQISDKDLSLSDLKEQIPSLLVKEGTHEEYNMSRDEKVIDILVYPKNPPSNLNFTVEFYKELNREVEILKAKYGKVKISYYGPYRKRLDEYSLVQHDANWIGWLTMLAVAMVVILYYRQFFPVLVISLPLAIGLFWTMGVTYIIVGKLNTITAFLWGILDALGVDFCIYLYSRYLEERREGRSQMDALTDSVSQTGRAAFTSGLNTALVFISLMLADFRGFSEFGLIAGVGLIICYMVIYFLLPAFIIWFENLGWLKTRSAKSFLGLPWPSVPNIIPDNMRRYPYSKFLIVFTVGLIVAFFALLPHIEFEYDFGKLRSDMISYTAEEILMDRFNFGAAKSNAAMLIMNSREDINAVNKAIDEQIKTNPVKTTLRGFSSFYDVWPPPEVQKSRMLIIDEIRDLMNQKSMKTLKGKDKEDADELRTYLNVKPYALEAVPKDMVQAFSPRKGPIGSYGYVLAKYEIRTKDGRDAMRFAKDAREIKTANGNFYASSQEIVFADILGLMLHESRLTIFIAISLITVFVWLDFWNVPKTLLVLVPVTTGTMLTMILLYCFGGKITFYNMIVIPMIIGMGEDSAVHLYHRYSEEGRGSICKVLKTTGVAVCMATVTNVLGFIGLIFSHHKGLQSIGYLAAAGLSGCLICSLLVLPAIVQVLEDFIPDFPGKPHHAQDSSPEIPALSSPTLAVKGSS